MKQLFLVFSLVLLINLAQAQDSQTKQEIYRLEEKECAALLKNDRATLRSLWSDQLISSLSSDDHTFVIGNQTFSNYALYERQNDQIFEANENVVFSMGRELVVPIVSEWKPGASVARHYTNIWKKENGSWKLIGRHVHAVD